MTGIDRDALVALLIREPWGPSHPGAAADAADRIIALVQPTGSGTLTREEEAPVPPLPTAPHTVIRATWAPGLSGAAQETYVLTHALGVWTNVNSGIQHAPSELLGGITAWEPVSEPRAVTAKAVLDRVDQELADPDGELPLAMLRREFGVES